MYKFWDSPRKIYCFQNPLYNPLLAVLNFKRPRLEFWPLVGLVLTQVRHEGGRGNAADRADLPRLTADLRRWTHDLHIVIASMFIHYGAPK